jgi:uncharacterized damage-inducible protein DinB
METEQMMARLLAEIRTNREELITNQEMLAKMEAKENANLRETNAETKINQERAKAQVEANNEKFEALRGTLRSRMDIQQVWTEAIQEEIKAKMNKNQEKMEATIGSCEVDMRIAITSIRADLEESMKDRASLDHKA